jgi:hypothetical protein
MGKAGTYGIQLVVPTIPKAMIQRCVRARDLYKSCLLATEEMTVWSVTALMGLPVEPEKDGIAQRCVIYRPVSAEEPNIKIIIFPENLV